jgi:hypothetical protein
MAGYILVAAAFPSTMGQVMGIMEIFVGMGYALVRLFPAPPQFSMCIFSSTFFSFDSVLHRPCVSLRLIHSHICRLAARLPPGCAMWWLLI